MICPTCKGTGLVKIPLFTSIVEEPCGTCTGAVAVTPPGPGVRFVCGGTVDARSPWISSLLRCSLGHWHTRGEYLQGKAA